MNNSDLARRRLQTQGLVGEPFGSPEVAAHWLGAIQAQDYAGAKWAIGLRTRGTTDAAIDHALADGTLLRTHVLRPTWHLVPAADLCWMLALTAPHVHVKNAPFYRRLGFDDDLLRRSTATLVHALAGGQQRTRAELVAEFQQAGIVSQGLGYLYLLMRAELDAVICSGALRGKQHTYALLEERAPHPVRLQREEALAELTRRYFTGHGPATLADYRWWSGLPATDIRRGIYLVKGHLVREVVDGVTYWDVPGRPIVAPATPTIHLLPNYDEYLVGYTDRRAVYDPADRTVPRAQGDILFSHTILLDGQVVGIWKRTLQHRALALEVQPFRSLSTPEQEALLAAVERYHAFVARPVHVQAPIPYETEVPDTEDDRPAV